MNIFKILRQNLHLKDELKPKLVLHVSKEPEPVIEYIGIGKVENEGYYEQCGPDDQKCNFDNIIENLTKEKKISQFVQFSLNHIESRFNIMILISFKTNPKFQVRTD